MRPTVYLPVHKGLRSTMFSLAFDLDRLDGESVQERRRAVEAFQRLSALLREHHRHEAEHAEAMLVPRAPEVVADNTRRHAELDRMLGELDEVAARAASEPGLVAALVGRYRQFLWNYLQHMQFEETTMQEAFWAHCTDEELLGIHGKVQAALGPARFFQWLEFMLPAMNVDERAAMLGGLKAHAPPPAYAAASDLAQRVLGPAAWQAVQERGL